MAPQENEQPARGKDRERRGLGGEIVEGRRAKEHVVAISVALDAHIDAVREGDVVADEPAILVGSEVTGGGIGVVMSCMFRRP